MSGKIETKNHYTSLGSFHNGYFANCFSTRLCERVH